MITIGTLAVSGYLALSGTPDMIGDIVSGAFALGGLISALASGKAKTN